MATPRELTRPPIMEALVDLRIVTDRPVTLEQLAPLRDELRESFPKVEEKRQFSGEFRVEVGKLMPPTSRDLGFHGLWLMREDGHRIVQFRRDGFTFNNVGAGHYMGGEALIDEALRLWARYADIVMPTTVVRVALRYINRLSLPLRAGDVFSTYLTAPPDLPEGAPQSVSGFLSRIVAHDPTGAQVIVTQQINAKPQPDEVLLLDLDVSYPLEPGIAPTADSIRPYLEMLRNLKNQTFFSLLTEETVKLFL